MPIKKTLTLILLFFLIPISAWADLFSYELGQSSPRPAGNSVVEIIWDGKNLWVATSSGLSRTSDGGTTWENFHVTDGLNSEEISALAGKDSLLWVATSISQLQQGQLVPTGTGFNKSTDIGASFLSFKPEQANFAFKLAYDIALADSFVWASCFAGALIRTKNDSVWQNVFVDVIARDDYKQNGFGNNLNNRFFSVVADTLDPDTTVIWTGTAAGVYKFIYAPLDSTDTLFTPVDSATGFADSVIHYGQINVVTCSFIGSIVCDSADSANGYHIEIDTLICDGDTLITIDSVICFATGLVVDTDFVSYARPGISGNFVVSLALQTFGSKKIIWAGTQPTFNPTEFPAASKSEDNGKTWSATLAGDLVWNFAFQDSIVWAATSSGLKKSTDLGQNWSTYDFIQDSFDSLGNQITSREYFAVRTIGDTVWAGGEDGLVKTTDGGTTWKVFRTYVPIGTQNSKTAYAYPSPFSPQLSTGITRIHYAPKQNGKVTIKIYDFALNLVATLLNNQIRQAGVEYDEIWDGRNKDGKIVANGIYFFKVDAEGGQKEWGKVAVIR
ncbi:MAG: glycosyl hydrolase family protein [candidate division Zixibacteria bacterium RBG-1]|nr:MAG: glycosyl hydrolase family protein [candidate division Zixibacteria bacterium RBG-1]OGC83473.1 MAG: hypothetical protein A2V73_01875 [candidate division Zixibacteria bacterium RBG_19FT_COMBO_42_43]